MKRWLSQFACLVALILGIGLKHHSSSTVVAAPQLDSGTFNLAQINDTQTVYSTVVTPDWVAVTVATTAGLCQVEHFTSGNWVSLGTVATGSRRVFEGTYVTVRVKAQVASTAGLYSVRGPTDDTEDSDFLVGGGAAAPSSTPMQVFATSSSAERTIFLTVLTGPVSLRATSSGPDLITVPAGTKGYYQGQFSAAWLVGPGTVEFSVLETLEEETWVPLPQAHWSDQFCPLWLDVGGVLCEGDPFAEEDDQVLLTRQVWDDMNEENDPVEYVDNEVLINFVPTASASAISELLGDLDLEIRTASFHPNVGTPDAGISWFHARILATSEYYEDVEGLIEHLNEQEIVDFAEHNDMCEFGVDWPPENAEDKDQYYDEQYELSWLGADLTELEDDGGWDTETGNGMCVVLVDSGVETEHEDLTDRIYAHSFLGDPSPRELGMLVGPKGLKYGWIDKNGDLRQADTSYAQHGHATALAGIICAEPYNELGVAGCGPDLRVMSARLHRPTKAWATKLVTALTQNFRVSTYNELRVVNMSFFVKQSSAQRPTNKNSLGKAILADLASNDRLYVGCAGQKPVTGKEKAVYPAAWAEVLGVTGAGCTAESQYSFSGADDGRDPHSNYFCGPGADSTPDLSVYGVSAYFKWNWTTDYSVTGKGYTGNEDESGKYAFSLVGTSGSTAQVSALAALLYGKAKRISLAVTYQDIDAHIKSNVKSTPLEFLDPQDRTKAIPGVVDFKAAIESLGE